MSNFKIHSVESAPEQSQPILEGAKKQMGRVPGLLGVLAESPNILYDNNESSARLNGAWLFWSKW